SSASSAEAASESSGTSSKRPCGGVTVTTPASMSTDGTISATNGTSTVPRGVSTASKSCAGKCCTSLTVPTVTPSRCTARPTSWWWYQALSSCPSETACSSIQRIARIIVSTALRSGSSLKKPTGAPL